MAEVKTCMREKRRRKMLNGKPLFLGLCLIGRLSAANDFPKPYSPPCVERENVFEFTEKPQCRFLGDDKYAITFAVKGRCDVTVAIVDPDPAKELVKGRGVVVRHLASGVLGPNAPAPFQKNSLKQTIYWDGKCDLGEYHRQPEKLKMRVMLGLKPEFDKRLGGTSPHNLPGYACGIAVGPEGAMVFSLARRIRIRAYDHDGEYLRSVLPPPADLPEEQYAGMGFVEYEPGKKALHGPEARETVASLGNLVQLNGDGWGNAQPAMHGGRAYLLTSTPRLAPTLLHYFKIDGTTEVNGVRGVPFTMADVSFPRLTVSPDGKWLYMTCSGGAQFSRGTQHVVQRFSLAGNTQAEPFIGKFRKRGEGVFTCEPGSDELSFNNPAGLACDAEGRIYVCDYANNRMQIFSPEALPLKTLRMDRPMFVQVHQKTGAIYALHLARVEGKTVGRLTKFASWPDCKEEFRQDNLTAGVFALDSWSPKPRLWLAGGEVNTTTRGRGSSGSLAPVVVYEEDQGTLREIINFDERAKRDDGPFHYGRWQESKGGGSNGGDKIVCDPVRERAYIHCRQVYDLKTGHYLRNFTPLPHRISFEDLGLDKKGYMHVHFNPGFYTPGVGRVDPSQARPYEPRGLETKTETYVEVPYDYGVVSRAQIEAGGKKDWLGILPVKDQKGAKFFQDGLGVNMRGDVAVQSNIYYVPKMEKDVLTMLNAGAEERSKLGSGFSTGGTTYADFMRDIEDRQKHGEEVYSIRRKPGIDLSGGTIWTFNSYGELQKECAVLAGGLINGAQLDENLSVYFVTWRPRIASATDGAFLAGKGGVFGLPDDKSNRNPHTGTYVKTMPDAHCEILSDNAPVRLEPLPARTTDLTKGGTNFWVEGHEWLYAGASPIVDGGCSCQTMRPCVDWYRRSFVTEAYRHSIGVLDPAGNLVMRIGQFGNFDSGNGLKSKIPVGPDGIAFFQPRMVSATDNYIVCDSWCERYTVMKMAYHAEEAVPINMK
jgi:hypothetical protein